MAQEIINIGAAANDGTGDPLRTAFDKVNNNFTQLYTTLSASGPDGAIQFKNTNTLYSTLYVGGTYLVAGAPGRIYYSNDGAVWSPVTTGTEAGIYSLAYDGIDTIIAVGATGTILRSTDGGVTWASATSGVTENLYGAVGYNGSFAVVGANGTILTSSVGGEGYTIIPTVTIAAPANSGGITATATATIANGRVSGFTITEPGLGYNTAPTVTIANPNTPGITATATAEVGGGIVTAVNLSSGITWNEPVTGITNTLTGITHGNLNISNVATPIYVATGVTGTIVTSTNLVTWSSVSTGESNDLYSAVIDPLISKLIVVGDNGTVLTTFNASLWTNETSNVSTTLTSIAFGVVDTVTNLISVGDAGTVIRSNNGGVNWYSAASNTTSNALLGVTFVSNTSNISNSSFIAVGSNATVIESNALALANAWTLQSVGSALQGDANLLYFPGTQTLSANANIVPGTDSAFSLGTPNLKFTDLYLAGNSLHLGTTVITSNANNSITFAQSSNTANLSNLIANSVATQSSNVYGNANVGGYLLANNVTTYNLSAANANIPNLISNVANANIINANRANIGNLTAANANITSLTGGNANLTGNITANYFFGSGEFLTGIGNFTTGNVTFDDVTVQGDNTSLNLSAGPDFTANSAYLQVRAGDVATHIHLDTGNNAFYDQYFGDDSKYLKLEAGDAGNVMIGAYDGNARTWIFGNDGRLTFPGTPRIDTADDNFEVQAAENVNFEANATVNIYTDASGNTYQWQFGDDGNLTLPSNTFAIKYANGTPVSISTSELVNGDNSFVLDADGNVVFEGDGTGQAVDRGLVWDYGANANGVNSQVRQDNDGITVRAWTEQGGGANGYSAPINIVTNQDANTNTWTFDGQGNLTLAGNIQSVNTAFMFTGTITSIESFAYPTPPLITITENVFEGTTSGQVTISNLTPSTGTPQANGTWYYESVGDNQFALYTDAGLTEPVDTSSWTAYLGGGGNAVSIGEYTDFTIQGGNVTIGSNGNTWVFDAVGDINIPAGAASFSQGRIQSANGYPTLLAYGTGEHGGPELDWANTNNVNDLSNANVLRNTLYINDGGLYVGMNENNVANTFTGSWRFTPTGTTIFPTLEVDLHNGGVQSGQVLQFGNSSQQAIITGPTPDANVSAQRIIIQGQRGNGELSEGGDVYVWGGDSETNGGDIKIYAGDADNVSTGSGGYVNIDGGAGFDDGGDIEITGGYSVGGIGGDLLLRGGQGSTQGGNVSIQSGYGEAGPGGNITIQASGSANGLAEYGNVNIISGASTWIFGNDGRLTFPGTPRIDTTDDNFEVQAAENVNFEANAVVNIYTDSGNNAFQWQFGDDGILTLPGNIDMSGKWVGNIGYAVANTDAASKQYVDTLVSTGISYHQPVNAASTTTLAVATTGTTAYNEPNGSGNGIGAYISTTGTFTTIDGVTINGSTSIRILVKDEANAAWNGVYNYTNATAITRTTDTDEYGIGSPTSLSINDYFFTQAGTVNAGAAFIVSAPNSAITFGTSNITFSTFSTSQVYTASTGINIAGTVISANASQTQITAVGTLGNLDVSGNINASILQNGNSNVTITANANITLTAKSNATMVITDTGVNVTGNITAIAATATTSSTVDSVGYQGIPQQSKSANYTTVIGDAGKHVYVTATATITIDSNANVAYPIGTSIMFIANTGATATIAINSDTLTLAGTGTTGSRTLAPFGMATAVKVTNTIWFISGNGLT